MAQTRRLRKGMIIKMRKTYKYTILTLLLTIVFTLGSTMGMNFILRARERQLLNESGKTVVEAPVRAWLEQESSAGEETEENVETADTNGYTLTAEQIEEVLKCWDESSMEIIHSPVNGQISMETAIDAGEDWLVEMGMKADSRGKNAELYSVDARLESPMQETASKIQLEPYYSFWFVRFSGRSMRAFLYINAVTGQVWNADIIFYEDLPKEMSDEEIKKFAGLCGLQTSDTSTIAATENQNRTLQLIKLEDSNLCARMEWYVLAGPDGIILVESAYDNYYEYEPDGYQNVYSYKEYEEKAIVHFRLMIDKNG